MLTRIKKWWRLRKEYRRLRELAAMENMREEMGFIRSRPLNQHDTVECCQWVLDNCRHSLRTRKGKGTRIIVEQFKRDSERRVEEALAVGLTEADDWALMTLPPLLLECSRERMLFKLTWG